jgi:hypothetical protein
MSTQHILVIIIPTIIIIAIVTLIRYFTRTGVFKGRKNKDSKK